MTIKCGVYVASSLDGYIARPNGDIEWLEQQPTSGPDEDYGYSDFIKTIDCIVMGRNTFEKVLSFSEWPYTHTRVVVLSSTLSEIPKGINGLGEGMAECYSGALDTLLDKLKSEGCTNLYIDGGKTIQAFLNQSLITDITITTIPILLGDGIRLFQPTELTTALRHISTQSYSNGFVQTRYQVIP